MTRPGGQVALSCEKTILHPSREVLEKLNALWPRLFRGTERGCWLLSHLLDCAVLHLGSGPSQSSATSRPTPGSANVLSEAESQRKGAKGAAQRSQAWPPNRAQRPETLFWPIPVRRPQQSHKSQLRRLLLVANVGTGAERLGIITFIPGCRTAIQSQPAATAPIRMQDLKDCPQGLVFCMFNVHEGSGSNPRCQCGGTFEEVPRHSASNRSLHLHSSSLITVFITLNITPPI